MLLPDLQIRSKLYNIIIIYEQVVSTGQINCLRVNISKVIFKITKSSSLKKNHSIRFVLISRFFRRTLQNILSPPHLVAPHSLKEELKDFGSGFFFQTSKLSWNREFVQKYFQKQKAKFCRIPLYTYTVYQKVQSQLKFPSKKLLKPKKKILSFTTTYSLRKPRVPPLVAFPRLVEIPLYTFSSSPKSH